MNEQQQRELCETVRRSRRGDEASVGQLFESLQEELRRIAGACMRKERPTHTLQATALVNEAYVRLVGGNLDAKSRTHFAAVAARAMRFILIEYERARKSEKRGGERRRVHVESENLPGMNGPDTLDVLALDEALQRLEEKDERASRVVELRYFGGLSNAEVAEELGVSEGTVYGDWKAARAWLQKELS